MKVIFLDIDGVLNNNKTYSRMDFGAYTMRGTAFTREDIDWDTDCVDQLKRIVLATGAKIVISSTWRKLFSLDELRLMFAMYEIDAEIIGCTPESQRGFRGDEINQYLSHHTIEDYIIIDDDTDFYPQQQRVKTSIEVGLTKRKADKAIKGISQ